MANKSHEAGRREVVVRPDEKAIAEAAKLAEGIAALVGGGTELYVQLVKDKGHLGFDPLRLALLEAIESTEIGSPGLAENLVNFRRALKALSSVTEIAGLPIDQMQIRVAALGAALKKQELLRRQKGYGEVIVKPGVPRNLEDVMARGHEVGKQLALRGEVNALDRQIAASPYQPGMALEKVLSLPEMAGIFHLAVLYSEAMAATKEEFDLLLADLVAEEQRLTGKAITAGRVNNVFRTMEERRLALAGQIKVDQGTLAAFDTRAVDTGTRKGRMDDASKQIDSMAKAAKDYNDAFITTVQGMLQMKSLAMGAVTDREMMEIYLTGLKYLMTIYYMQAAGLAGCLTGAARIVGAGMKEYLEAETKKVMGQVGESLGLVEDVVDQVTGELQGLMHAGAILEKPKELDATDGGVVNGEYKEV